MISRRNSFACQCAIFIQQIEILKQHDRRQIYVLIKTPDFLWHIACFLRCDQMLYLVSDIKVHADQKRSIARSAHFEEV